MDADAARCVALRRGWVTGMIASQPVEALDYAQAVVPASRLRMTSQAKILFLT